LEVDIVDGSVDNNG